MSTIKFFKDHAGHNSAYRLNFGEEGSKDWNGTSILFAGYMFPISKHVIMLVEFKKLPHFFEEFDYHNLWRNIQGFCEEITEEEFNKIANEKLLSEVVGEFEIRTLRVLNIDKPFSRTLDDNARSIRELHRGLYTSGQLDTWITNLKRADKLTNENEH